MTKSHLNPFVWNRPLADPSQIVGMDDFAATVAGYLRSRTNVVLFGPRGTGKTTFATKLAAVLDTDNAKEHALLLVNLESAFSIAALVGCVQTAITDLPKGKLRRRAMTELQAVEKSLGVDLRLINMSVKKSAAPTQDPIGRVLHDQLRSLARIAEEVYVIFDEAQTLRRCAGEPLAIIRSALLTTATSNVSLLFTGSLREGLRLMTTSAAEPLFNQAVHVEMPDIPYDQWADDIETRFGATGLSIDEDAIEHLLDLTECHPRRTQQLAWYTWEAATHSSATRVERVAIHDAFEQMINAPLGFEAVPNDEDAPTEYRTLLLLADRGSTGITNETLLASYGVGAKTTLYRALEALVNKALLRKSGDGWVFVDPVLGEWLRRRSPFRPTER